MESLVKKILVTGANGFIGKNLVFELKNRGYEVFAYDIDCTEDQLTDYCYKCEFVFNLAGINRPLDDSEFMQGNRDFLKHLIGLLKKAKNAVPIVITSSIQADKDNDYGKSKKAGEEVLFQYAKETGAKIFVYRLPNVFGKWARPNYNSAVATFCYNVSHGLDIRVDNESAKVTLVYIDDVLNSFLQTINNIAQKDGDFFKVTPEHNATVGFLASTIKSFPQMRKILELPNLNCELTKKLYATYLSYVAAEDASYELNTHTDNRGSFAEILRSIEKGQIGVNTIKANIVKGNHWHHTKNEKFIVVSGRGVIRLRKVGDDQVVEHFVSAEKLVVVEILPGYTHNIENTSKDDMVVVMWASEPFNPNNPDTFIDIV